MVTEEAKEGSCSDEKDAIFHHMDIQIAIRNHGKIDFRYTRADIENWRRRQDEARLDIPEGIEVFLWNTLTPAFALPHQRQRILSICFADGSLTIRWWEIDDLFETRPSATDWGHRADAVLAQS